MKSLSISKVLMFHSIRKLKICGSLTYNRNPALKLNELRLICALIRDSRRTDRELAKIVGVSQPTISRIRQKLEKEGYMDYAGIPNLQKLGFEIVAMTFGNWKYDRYPDTRVASAREFVKTHPNLIFLSSGKGMNSDRVAITVHRDYTDYTKFLSEVRTDWGEYMEITGSFLISLRQDEPLRSFTFTNLADILEETKEAQTT